ncbi:hypothetical protein J3E71DRAFT_171256 [Bipolaris maydis]|nr:hypothetical protein J3E71DRAFT_171256 [Bipolaris maydis]
MRHWFIQRTYSTQDLWGKQLNLIASKHDVRELDIAFDPKFHEVSAQAEQRPQRPALSTADPTAYHSTILNNFPNVLSAIEQWQAKNPAEPPIIGARCTWACRGSAKIDYVVKTIKDVDSQKTTIPHPDPQRATNGETFSYQRKYIVASSIRLCRALLWCRVVQEVGEACVASVMSRMDRNVTMNGWRNRYMPNTYDLDDKVWIMVAALGVICQSVTLTEGNILHGLELPPNNSVAQQTANRQHRIGQTQDVVEVQWLVHKNSVTEDKIMAKSRAKNSLASNIGSTRPDENKGKEARQEKQKKAKTNKGTEIVDMTLEDEMDVC